MDEGEVKAVVMDIGSGTTKCGIAGDDEPMWIKPSLVDISETIGLSQRLKTRTERVMERGEPKTITALEQMMSMAIRSGTGVDPCDHPLLYLTRPKTSDHWKRRITEIAFETTQCPAFWIGVTDVTALYAMGRTTGVSVGLGYGISTATPILEGYDVLCAELQQNYGMQDTIQHMKLVLEKQGIAFNDANTVTTSIGGMIDRVGIVSQDYETDVLPFRAKQSRFAEVHKAIELGQYFGALPAEIIDHIQRFATHGPPEMARYELPDGQTIQLGEERMLMGELLFNPALLQFESESEAKVQSLPAFVNEAITEVNFINWKDLYSNIIIYGAQSMFPGMADRLHTEIVKLVRPSIRVKIVAAPERKHAAWVGGSIVASLSTFNQMWITKVEGAQAMYAKCF